MAALTGSGARQTGDRRKHCGELPVRINSAAADFAEIYCVVMPDDEIPRLADWLAEYRSRPEPTEVVVASYDMIESIPDAPQNGMDAGRVALDIVRYDAPERPGPPDLAHYVMGVNARGEHLWDDWYESEQAARKTISEGHYGEVVERPSSA